jgi:hypothetical protein
MVCNFIGRLVTISPNVEMLHNNILGVIKEMQSKVDIEDEKKQHNAFEKAFEFQTPMPLDDSTMVVHIGSNPLILKHKKVVQRWARIKHP